MPILTTFVDLKDDFDADVDKMKRDETKKKKKFEKKKKKKKKKKRKSTRRLCEAAKSNTMQN
jgi:hypothetical protein